MTPQSAKPTNIEEYIDAAPEAAQGKLREMLACLREAAPGAEEGLKWSMPALSYHRMLVAFAAFKNHIGFYPTSSPIKVFEKNLAAYKTSKGAIQFPLDKPLPLDLISKITRFRVQESLVADVKWRS